VEQLAINAERKIVGDGGIKLFMLVCWRLLLGVRLLMAEFAMAVSLKSNDLSPAEQERRKNWAHRWRWMRPVATLEGRQLAVLVRCRVVPVGRQRRGDSCLTSSGGQRPLAHRAGYYQLTFPTATASSVMDRPYNRFL
jgi:hypothetical protein